MNKTFWNRFLDCCSDNRKSKTCGERSRTIQNRKRLRLSVITVVLVAGAVAQAQQPTKIPRIGFLDPSNASSIAGLSEAFRQELSKLGWSEGKNIIIEYRFAEQKSARLPELAAELVRLKVDLIVASGERRH
jgi:putative ABC transport system substrate-binding protein